MKKFTHLGAYGLIVDNNYIVLVKKVLTYEQQFDNVYLGDST